MASTTTTEQPGLVLEAPAPVKVLAPEKASGLVPLKEEQRTQLDAKVDAFIEELVAEDVNSPEFGKRVDSISNMGRKEIAEASGRARQRPPGTDPRSAGARDRLGEQRRR